MTTEQCASWACMYTRVRISRLIILLNSIRELDSLWWAYAFADDVPTDDELVLSQCELEIGVLHIYSQFNQRYDRSVSSHCADTLCAAARVWPRLTRYYCSRLCHMHITIRSWVTDTIPCSGTVIESVSHNTVHRLGFNQPDHPTVSRWKTTILAECNCKTKFYITSFSWRLFRANKEVTDGEAWTRCWCQR